MTFLSKAEADPLRREHAFRRGLEYLERDDYQRAWLAGNSLRRACPKALEGHLLCARVDDRKARVLDNPLYYLDSLESYREVLARDPQHEEARRRVAEIEALKLDVKTQIPAAHDRYLGMEPVAFKDCQVGYHPRATKSVIIWTLADFAGGEFKVVDAITGAVVFTGKLVKYGEYAWKRHHWGADFSAVDRPGEYLLAVSFAGGPQAVSHGFPISAEVPARCLRLSLEGFFNHRCGQELPWRSGCNPEPIRFRDRSEDWLEKSLEDGLEELSTPLPIHHGWHDGGNWERVACNSVTNLYCLLLGHHYAPQDWHRLGEPAPDTLVEARWGADYYLSCLEACGTAQVVTMVHGTARAPDGRRFLTRLYVSHEAPEQIQCVRIRQSRSEWIPWYPRLYAAALAKLARLYQPYDAAYAQRCTAAAVKLQAYHRDPDPGETLTISSIACIALGDLHLWRLTGDAAYRERALAGLSQVVAHQEPDGFFPVTGVEERALYLAGCWPQLLLFEAAEEFVGEPAGVAARDALSRFLPWVERLTGISPFGHLMEYRKEHPRNLISAIHDHGANSYLAYGAILCLLANRLFGTHRYTPIAERQVQWLFGRNPRGLCLMGGAGYRHGSQHLMDLFDHGAAFRQVPGFVCLGLRGIPVDGLGPDYPFFCTWDVDGAGQGYSIYWSTCEGGGMTEGPVYAALALLAREYDSQQQGGAYA